MARVCESLRPSSHMILDLGAPGKGPGTRGPAVTPGHAQSHAVERPSGEEAAEGPRGTNGASEKVSMCLGFCYWPSVEGGRELL